MKLEENYDLAPLNTFGVESRARLYAEINSQDDILELFSLPEFHNNERLFLGGGSNILFTHDFGGIVIKNNLKGIEIVKADTHSVTIKAMSGEVWHDLVQFSVERGLWGIENLALIPGTVGGAPIQNIGAYGAELKETIQTVEVYEVATAEKKILTEAECHFGYRDSIFKTSAKGKYFIAAITLKLSKIENKNISYKVLLSHLEQNNIEPTHPKHISDAVSGIRRSKLPDPKVIGNAGSFFKNVILENGEEKLKELLSVYPDMPHFKEEQEGMEIIKIPAGWLIEHTGPADGTSWKGYREGAVGVHDKQALVLVNHGEATGLEIKALADKIIASVEEKFGLKLAPEVNLI